MSNHVPEELQARAKKLHAYIDVIEDEDRDLDDELELGPFMLLAVDEQYSPIWDWGLPLEGIIVALDCWEAELREYDMGANSNDAIPRVWQPFYSWLA
jgi:hypothetical protein